MTAVVPSDRADLTAAVVVNVAGLTVTTRAGRPIVCGVDLVLGRDRVLGVIGESGSGKSTLVRCILGSVAPGLEAKGTVAVQHAGATVDMFTADRSAVRAARSSTLAFLGQNPAAALTPTMRIGHAVAERVVGVADRAARTRRVAQLFDAVRLPVDDAFLARFPHELSGGQAQRVALARALASQPSVLLLDEPTTGLDVVTQQQILDELERQQLAAPRSVLIVSHDLAVVARMADEVVVMRDGAVVEAGRRHAVLGRPTHDYTQTLVAACPDAGRVAPRSHATHGQRHDHAASAPVLELVGVHATHRAGRRRRVVAAAGVDLDIHPGECVALVGSSGSGKSTLARLIVGVHPPDAGCVRLGGVELALELDARSRTDRWAVQMVPQDAGASLNPRRRVGRIVADAVGRRRPGCDADAAARKLLVGVGLDSSIASRRPSTLSGGERQRVAIARALAAEPLVLVCDEVTSALDVSVQAGVLDLLRSLVDDRGLGILFITHDLGVVARIADRVAVLEGGTVCEHGSVGHVLADPSHEITRRLLDASPSLTAELARAPARTTRP